MNIKKILSVLLVISLTGCSAGSEPTNLSTPENPASIIVTTDTHFISDKINDYGPSFMASIENADGKITRYSIELVDALISEVIEKKPDAFILGGDLTLLGGRDSHLDLAEKLKLVQTSGIPVLVMAGNHDIDSFSAVKFVDMTYTGTETVDKAEFAKIYGEFGYNNALSKDKTSMSYFYEVHPDLWVLMLDVNAGDEYNGVSDKTYKWIESNLKKAKKSGAKVISVTHQNLMVHTELFTSGYIINGAQKIIDLYKEYGVICNLTGHLHMQHIAETDGFTEIVTSALAMSPNQYGNIKYDGKEFTYRTQITNVQNWALNLVKTDNDLLNFIDYSQSFFKRTSYNQALRSLAEVDLSEEERINLANYFADMNYAYFSGTMSSKLANDPRLKLWQEQAKSSFFSSYIDSILKEADAEHNSLTITFE